MGSNPYPSVAVENLFQWLQDGHRMDSPSRAQPDVYVVCLSLFLRLKHISFQFCNYGNVKMTSFASF